MDRMRDVPGEEYATLHDVYMMLTSEKKGIMSHVFPLVLYNSLILFENNEIQVRMSTCLYGKVSFVIGSL